MPPEDLLRGLIEDTDLNNDTTNNALQGLKRPHDDETADEPLAKRDKLGEELDRLFALNPSPVSATASSGSATFSISAAAAYPSPIDGPSIGGPPGPTVPSRTRGTLPIRAARRRLPRVGNGTVMSRSGIPETSEPASSSDNDSEC
ncbi:predicted protein [Chaetomium globosum CBS 148.51]|uniref:Uncharacterized protein n=1 Tax=Chaetomium globosum (strain ATCC 6205 / CBS 148.51 / DSM 1962 / NBRC 6347 / NRRL 1970) TaxID=306901 RepID=Q2H0P9_CHAGB|nr:uncharacterized protein CHGG_04647 [Chaetomium globosum CBS 148.51]EAQ88028.1 predicted protein [Chaetomium globosum CBS 148.51]